MYRTILILTAILVLGGTSVVQSQDYYAYKESGELVSLTVQDSGSLRKARRWTAILE